MNKKVIPYGRQNITADDIKAVSDTLQSDFLTQGPAIKEFEMILLNILEQNMLWLSQMVLLLCICAHLL